MHPPPVLQTSCSCPSSPSCPSFCLCLTPILQTQCHQHQVQQLVHLQEKEKHIQMDEWLRTLNRRGARKHISVTGKNHCVRQKQMQILTAIAAAAVLINQRENNQISLLVSSKNCSIAPAVPSSSNAANKLSMSFLPFLSFFLPLLG